MVDDGNAQRETNEANNVTPVALTVGKPDLTITTATAPAAASLNETITLSWTVQNLSAAYAAAAGWSDYVYLSDDNVLDAAVDRVLLTQGISTQTPLAPRR